MGPPEIGFDRRADGVLVVRFTGSWVLDQRPPAGLQEQLQGQLGEPGLRGVAFDCNALSAWDSGLVTVVVRILEVCRAAGIEADCTALPEGARKLVELAAAVPEREGAARDEAKEGWLVRVGKAAQGAAAEGREQLRFVGEATLAFGRFVTGRASFRRADLWQIVQDCGASALPIVTLISVLVGLILAFVGAVQLRKFGATIYVADLVGIGMARQMGAIMTAIIMAGRTGASFAAQLGTMTVNEEIDALRTLGVSPMEFLVVPRMLALMLMMPLLCLYSILMGMLGGFIVAVTMLEIAPLQYYEQTRHAVELHQFGIGLLCATVFGVLVALAGCLRGMQCGRSAQAVGLATTSAVVTGIVWIVVSDGVLTVVFDRIGI